MTEGKIYRSGQPSNLPSHLLNALPWSAAVAMFFFLFMFSGILSGITADDDAVLELTVEQARQLAYDNNIELQLSYLALEQGELALETLSQSILELERQRSELLSLQESLEEERERLQQEIDGSDDPVEKERLNRALRMVEASIAMTNQALEVVEQILDQLNDQYNRAEAAYAEGEKMIELQKEMLGFKVESLFTGALIILEQQPLQQAVLAQQALLVSAEREKEKMGYSTPLGVEEASAGVREMEALGDDLQLKYVMLVDELCLACGLTPGRPLSLVPFAPIEPRPVDLDQAVAEALASGWLVRFYRERVIYLEAERDRIEQEYGRDSLRYRMAGLAVRQARLELQQAEMETRAAVRRAYYALIEKENRIGRAEADLVLGNLQKAAIAAGYQAGHKSAAEAALGPLALHQKEAELARARYSYHLAYLEFELARHGYISSAGQQERLAVPSF